MNKNGLRDLASTILLIGGVSCASLSSTSSSDVMRPYENAYYNDANKNYGSDTEIPKEYQIKEKKIAVEHEAEVTFGEMRDATAEEQRNVLESIKEISEPTGLNFWD